MRTRLKSAVRIMAAIKEFGDEISDQFLVCKICFETYRNPKSLSCLHTFCASCLEQYLKSELARTQYRYVIHYRGITCPVCRKRTELPSGGVRHLPDNFLVSNLTEVVNRSKPSSRSPMCDFCLHAGRPSKVAISKCVECAKTLCKKCVDLHQRTKVTKTHTIMSMKAENNVVCNIHKDEPLRFFCLPCETCICVACTFREHYGHNVTSFDEGIDQYIEEMERLTSHCKSKMVTIQTHLDSISRCEANMFRVEDQIKTLASNLIVNIRIKQRQLLDEIRQFYGSEALELVDNKEELEQIMENLSTTCDLANFVLKDKDVEFLLLHKEVCDKMRSLIDLDLAQLPEKMFDEIKFVQGGMFFGYIDSGQKIKSMEYDVQPSKELPQIILDKLSMTSMVQATQTGHLENVRHCGTTMNSTVGTGNLSIQTEEAMVSTRRGSTQTTSVSTKSAGTETDIPFLRSRSQNTEKRDSLVTNSCSQTNIELVEALSECHPVLTASAASNPEPKMENACCGTEVLTATSGTTTEDLEMELIAKYLDLMETGEPHSPPYSIPFPVDIFDRCSPTSESLPLLTHIMNTVQKVDQCTNVPSVTDITAGSDIEVTNVMLKDSSTNTEETFVATIPEEDLHGPRADPSSSSRFVEESKEAEVVYDNTQSVYTYSDSYSESSPEEGETSADTSQDSISPLSDEDKYQDQCTLIDKDDLVQILAGEELVQWDERSALHDMIVLEKLRHRQKVDSAINTGDMQVRDRLFGESELECEMEEELGWQKQESFESDTTDPDDQTSSETSAPATPQRKSSLEAGHLTGKLESLFSMTKLLEMTKKLERRPSQSAGLVSQVTKKLERQISGDTAEGATSPQRRLSNTRRPSLTDSNGHASRAEYKAESPQNITESNVYIFAPKNYFCSESRKHSPPRRSETEYDMRSHAKAMARSQSDPRTLLSYKSESERRCFEKCTVGRRKQLARVRKPDISALLNLHAVRVEEKSDEEREKRRDAGPQTTERT